MSSVSFKNIIYKMCLEIIYLIYMYKKDLALNNQEWLICYKTKRNQTKSLLIFCHIVGIPGQDSATSFKEMFI